KSIQDINLSTRIADEQKSDAEELKIELDSLDKLEVENLKKRMFKASRDLQFEKAAVLRDKIDEIQKNL
ncbi:MAG: excinuclease ABC subunit B, partial [Candidatus Marinimicrobia bacterium]|nr:excinuclease ABC subunit B [Candidatus Neomarinimicrobiota bacterium]